MFSKVRKYDNFVTIFNPRNREVFQMQYTANEIYSEYGFFSSE